MRAMVGNNPAVYRRRTNFDLSHRVATTMKVGRLTPIDIVEVLPGDTWSMKTNSLTRLSTTLIRPIMDDMYLDAFSFFVPLRLCYDQLEEVFGDTSNNPYDDPDLSSLPFVDISSVSNRQINVQPGTVGDYLGLPTTLVTAPTTGITTDFSVVPFRAFALIYNEYFVPPGVGQPVNVFLGEYNKLEAPNQAAWGPTNYTGQLPFVRRYGDYFSTCLPAPQKGPAVKIPGFDAGSQVPVTTSSAVGVTAFNNQPLQWISGTALGNPADQIYLGGQVTGAKSNFVNTYATGTEDPNPYGRTLAPANLWAQTGFINDANINALRVAFQMQKYLERDAWYGSRYREYLYAAYGVISPDSRMQVPEFLGGSHNRLNIAQIPAQQSSTEYEVGQYAANINSLSERSGSFSKSFTEHGYIITVACIRYKHLYSQATSGLWFRRDREDFYDPLFANLGMQAVYTREIYPYSDGLRVFGYNEAFANYRTVPDRVSAQMRPNKGNIGSVWSLADRFDEVPSLSDVIIEDTDSFERVISASEKTVDPFIVDFYFRCSVARVVSPFGKPGLADHH